MAELEKYNKKRDFKKTAEPEGKVKGSKGKVIFMVQKHDASRLHFDFRIEVDGVLKSWAVPKGPPKIAKERHLAMMVEDHPYDYRTFEGTIPEGEYGGGTVMLWDEGTYYVPEQPAESKQLDWSTEEKDPKKIQEHVNQMIKNGSIKLYLEGKKLKGKYALVRFPKAGDNAWLMIKDHDEFEGKAIENEDFSVKTGRTMQEIASGEKSKKKVSFESKESQESEKDSVESTLPEIKVSKNIKPMLATLVDKPFDSADWIFEIKWDGYRALANVGKSGSIELISRNGIILNKDYPPILSDLGKLKEHIVLDGEITVVDKTGKSEFGLLQNYRTSGEGNLIYYVFDILEYKDKDLRGLSLTERKDLLKKVLPKLDHVKLSGDISEKGIEFFKLAQEKGLEGILAKKKNSVYEEGVRSENWLKVKIIQQQEVVIGGYTYPEGLRNGFGSLLIGVFQDKKLKYVGHTGSGFNEALLESVKKTLDKYKVKESPFADAPDMKNVAAWIEPKVVAEVKFQGWTESGYLRQAIFVGIREDIKPESVKREAPKEIKS